MQEETDPDESELKDEETIRHPFSEPESRRKNSNVAAVRKPVDLKGFQMSRLDVLHKMNQEHAKTIEK